MQDANITLRWNERHLLYCDAPNSNNVKKITIPVLGAHSAYINKNKCVGWVIKTTLNCPNKIIL